MGTEIELGELTLLPFRQLLAGTSPIELRRRPLALLSVLAEAGGSLVTKDELIERVWGGAIVEDNAIQAQVAALRRALGKHAHLVTTVHGMGYRANITAPPRQTSVTNLPSIAVLPFANMSDDAGQTYFVDGLMEEIVTSLTRIRTLLVIASGSTMSLKGQDLSPAEAATKLGVRYVLEGSVRRAGDDVRISVQLVDTETSTQIWADRFNDRYEDIFALQDRVATAVAGVIEFSVQSAEARRSIQRPTKDLRSYDLYLQALLHFRTYLRPSIFQARDLLEQALAIDPHFALALSQAAACHAIMGQFGWSSDPKANAGAMMALVEQSLQHGADDPQVLATASMTYWATHDIERAARLAVRSTELNPGSSWAWLARGKVEIALGQLDLADHALHLSIRLDPISPNRNLQVGALAALRFAQQRFDEALEHCREYVELNQQPLSLGMLAATCGKLGKDAQAADAFGKLRAVSPIALPALASTFYRDEALHTLFLEGIERAETLAATPA